MEDVENENVDTESPEEGPNPGLSNRVLIICATFLALPAMIPFYFGLQQDETGPRVFLFVFGFFILVANGLLLYLLTNWLKRLLDSQ